MKEFWNKNKEDIKSIAVIVTIIGGLWNIKNSFKEDIRYMNQSLKKDIRYMNQSLKEDIRDNRAAIRDINQSFVNKLIANQKDKAK